MPPRWSSLPPKAKVAKESKPRRKRRPPGRWLCRVDGCGEVIEGGETALERHLDAHGGGRADCIIEAKGSPMEKITVEVARLRQIVQENRDAHRDIFERACVQYRRRMIEELERNLDDIKNNHVLHVRIGLPVPEDHTDDYDRVLRMLDLSVDETIELSESDVAMYVQDDWAWKRNFAANTTSYLVS